MQNVLFVIPNQKLGGAEQLLKNVAKYLSLNYKVTVFFLSKTNTDNWNNLENSMSIITTSDNKKWRAVLELIGFLRRNRIVYDKVFSSQVYINGILGLLRRFRIIRTNNLIVRESTSIFLRYKGFKLFSYKIFYKLGYKYTDLVIFQSEKMKEQFFQKFNHIIKQNQSIVIPNPIDLANLNDNLTEMETTDGAYIVSAGRLIPEKGFDILIQAFVNVLKEFPDLKLIILGEGPEREKLEKAIKRLQIENAVRLTGFVKNVYPYFKNAEGCIVSSLIEGFPNVLLQMMSVNTKVVSTLCAGGIEDIKGLYTTQVGSAALLSDTIVQCLNADTTENLHLFEDELSKRSIPNYVKQIEMSLK